MGAGTEEDEGDDSRNTHGGGAAYQPIPPRRRPLLPETRKQHLPSRNVPKVKENVRHDDFKLTE
jgi:hypothetical protein